MASLEQIFGWFSRGLFPTQDQYKQTYSSFWHKSERLPQTQVLGLNDALNNKVDRDELISLGVGVKGYGDDVQDIADLENVPDKYEGLAVLVINDKDENGNSYVWLYDGAKWARTPFTSFPKDIQVKANLKQYLNNNPNDYISTKGIKSELVDKQLLNEDYIPLIVGMTTGGLDRATLKANNDTDYKRTSLTNLNTYEIKEGREYLYTGTIDKETYTPVIYLDSDFKAISADPLGVGVHEGARLTIPYHLGAVRFAASSKGGDPVIHEWQLTSKLSAMVVDTLGFDKDKLIEQESVTKEIYNSLSVAHFGQTQYDIPFERLSTKVLFHELKKGKYYVFYIELLSGKLSANINGIDKDGNATLIPVSFTEGKSIYFYNNLADFEKISIYFGSQSENGTIKLHIANIDKGVNPDLINTNDNVFTNSFFINPSFQGKGYLRMRTVGAYTLGDGKLIVPAGSFVAAEYDNSVFGFELGGDNADRLNMVCKSNNIEGAIIGVALDPVTPLTYGYVIRAQYSEYFKRNTIVSEKSAYSESNTFQIRFDNRAGTEDLIIEELFFWKGDFNTDGLLKNEVRKSIESLRSIKQVFVNLVPAYSQFNQGGNYVSLNIEGDTFTLTRDPDSGTAAYFGHKFACKKKDYKSLFVTLKNVKCDTDTRLVMLCQNAAGAEIARTTITLPTTSDEDVYEMNIADNTEFVLIRFQSGTGTKYFGCGKMYVSDQPLPASFVEINNNGGTEITNQSLIYVDVENGKDDNIGTRNAPVKSFAAAIDKTGNVTDIKVLGTCDTEEVINIRRKDIQSELRITSESGKQVRFTSPKITSGGFVDGLPNVYVVEKSIPDLDRYLLFQQDVADITTPILLTRRHPLHRGRDYRCLHSQMTRVYDIQDVKDNEHKYYYDAENKLIYFSIKYGTNLTDNPVIVPSGAGIYGNDGSVKVTLNNIEFLGRYANLVKCNDAKITDCIVFAGLSAGGYRYDHSIGIVFERCEAGRTFTGNNGGGDGFNGHSTYPVIKTTKVTTARFIDCYSHDNNDDGYSDHENCEATFIGGLFEWNRKGGLTPAYGAHDTFYNVTTQDNGQYGIGMVGGTAVDEGGYGGQSIAHGCISRYNPINYYCASDGVSTPNMLILVKCFSGWATNAGYGAGQNGIVDTYDCTDKDSPLPQKKTGNGIINVYEGVQLKQE